MASIKANKLRAIITMLIISIGITALVGILSAIDAIKNAINSNLSGMGANSFTIRNADANVRIGRRGRKSRHFPAITFNEAQRFRREFSNGQTLTSVSTMASWSARLRYSGKKTNPNIQVIGGDDNYLVTAGYELERGRNFTMQEASGASHVVLLGKDVQRALFNDREDPLDKFVKIGSDRYRVIGVLKTKGNGAGFGGDKVCVIPLPTARQYFASDKMSFSIQVMSLDNQLLDIFFNEARWTFRKIRHVAQSAPDNFDMVKSDSLAHLLLENIQKVTMGATIIGIITLLGAAIGLMNIMLVSVTERTREIGIRKATGANQSIIRNQFLIESVVICVMGGCLGILFGIVIGNLISLALDTGFFVPWVWIFGGLALCVVVGLLSGYLPARRAAELDPIDSLRFE